MFYPILDILVVTGIIVLVTIFVRENYRRGNDKNDSS